MLNLSPQQPQKTSEKYIQKEIRDSKCVTTKEQLNTKIGSNGRLEGQKCMRLRKMK